MNRTRRRTRTVLLGAVAALALVAAACVPEPAPANTTWEFKATKVTVNDVQDEVCVIVCVNRADEPYVMNIATRVKIGVPNSASGFVVSSRSNNPEGLEARKEAASVALDDMIEYLRSMATAADHVADGDLSLAVMPRPRRRP